MRPGPRPLWYYGFLCLIASALPAVLTKPPQDPEEIAGRFYAQMFFSVLGFGLVAVGLWQTWRNRERPR